MGRADSWCCGHLHSPKRHVLCARNIQWRLFHGCSYSLCGSESRSFTGSSLSPASLVRDHAGVAHLEYNNRNPTFNPCRHCSAHQLVELHWLRVANAEHNHVDETSLPETQTSPQEGRVLGADSGSGLRLAHNPLHAHLAVHIQAQDRVPIRRGNGVVRFATIRSFPWDHMAREWCCPVCYYTFLSLGSHGAGMVLSGLLLYVPFPGITWRGNGVVRFATIRSFPWDHVTMYAQLFLELCPTVPDEDV
ncbi:hypothetical protein DPMN_082203 [Dreissena polymorpha]|uniref:Uncharacterized protein n=1 Tax=Dreissena polymorpha TaxID=45954 RepID=A0A9D4BH26_DREPO|nr:hypothetical protein DPMN_082203 [Dreissena polymorpha]